MNEQWWRGDGVSMGNVGSNPGSTQAKAEADQGGFSPLWIQAWILPQAPKSPIARPNTSQLPGCVMLGGPADPVGFLHGRVTPFPCLQDASSHSNLICRFFFQVFITLYQNVYRCEIENVCHPSLSANREIEILRRRQPVSYFNYFCIFLGMSLCFSDSLHSLLEAGPTPSSNGKHARLQRCRKCFE